MNRVEANRAVVTGDRGPWMVLAHGLGGSPSDWDPFVSAFSDHFRVVTFAQAGSPAADPSAFSAVSHASLLGFADDLALLCAELGVREAVFVGHSFACTVAAIAAVADPGLFSRMVLINASPCYIDDSGHGYHSGYTASEVEDIRARMRSDYDRWTAGFGTTLMANPGRPELAAGFVDALRTLDPQVAFTAFSAVLTGDYRDVYPRIAVPTLVLHNEADPAVPMSVARWITATVPAARLVEMSTTGHFPHVVDPAGVIEAILGFLADTDGPSP